MVVNGANQEKNVFWKRTVETPKEAHTPTPLI